MERTQIEDIARIRCLHHLKLNPSGTFAAFVQMTPDLKENNEKNDLFLLDLKNDEVRQLTYNGKNGDFIWEDDHTILFPSERKAADKAAPYETKTVFYRLSIDGGEAREAFVIPLNTEHIEKISDGLYACLAFVDWNGIDADKEGKEKAEESLDYHILEETPFWGNGRGFVSGKRSVLFLYHEADQSLERITGKYTNVAGFIFHDRQIVYRSASWKDVMPLKNTLNVYDIETGTVKTIVEENTLYIGRTAFDGNNILFTAADMKKWGTGQLSDYYRADVTRGTFEKIRDNREQLAFGDTPLSDTIRKAGTDYKAVEGDLYFTAMHDAGISDLYCLHPDNRLEKKVDAKGGCIITFDTKDGIDFVYVLAGQNGLNQIRHNEKTVYDPNQQFMQEKYTAPVHSLSFTNRYGDKIDGFYLEPYGYDPNKKYPAVLEIHGGPRCAYGTVYMHEMQVLAADGMFVLFANPHGSEGYGEQFADIRGKYGTIDYEDLMDFVDAAVKKIPQIDQKRLGACGGSYGGFMCNWIEGHTDRFAAIASQRSVSNWVADFGASEIGVSFDTNEMDATPWTDMEKMWKQSPLKYADKATTPILFIHSLCDYNCTIDQGVEMFTAMRYFHVPSRMVVFEGENHGLSRNGRPKHRIRRLQEICRWFDIYLKGETHA